MVWGGQLRVKIGFFGVGCVAALFLLEAGLRVAGYFVVAARNSPYTFDPKVEDTSPPTGFVGWPYAVHPAQNEGADAIVTVGDSFTFAGNASILDSYPYHLHGMLNASGHDYAVINLGMCEDNTYGVAERLKAFVDGPQSDGLNLKLLVVLVGSADRFNYRGLGEDLPSRLASMQSFKMLRAMRLAVVQRFLTAPLREVRTLQDANAIDRLRPGAEPDGDSEDDSEDDDLEDGVGEDRRAGPPQPLELRRLEEAYALYSAVGDATIDGRLEDAQARARTASEFWRGRQSGDDWEVVVRDDVKDILFRLTALYAQALRHDDALAVLLNAGEHFAFFWNDGQLLFRVNQLFQIQSRFGASDVLKVLTSASDQFVELKASETFATFTLQMQDLERVDQEIELQRDEMWGRIVGIARANGMHVVAQNYPVRYSAANRAAARVAAKFDLPLVDNLEVFSRKTKAEGRWKYLEDDDHCTPEGYRQMAANVFTTIAPMLRSDAL